MEWTVAILLELRFYLEANTEFEFDIPILKFCKFSKSIVSFRLSSLKFNTQCFFLFNLQLCDFLHMFLTVTANFDWKLVRYLYNLLIDLNIYSTLNKYNLYHILSEIDMSDDDNELHSKLHRSNLSVE